MLKPNRCALCYSDNEDIDHPFMECRISKGLWEKERCHLDLTQKQPSFGWSQWKETTKFSEKPKEVIWIFGKILTCWLVYGKTGTQLL